jgi:hypothetical protein
LSLWRKLANPLQMAEHGSFVEKRAEKHLTARVQVRHPNHHPKEST